ncbi:MAG TPA: hypothetical protein DEF89_18975 [Desulfosporosinus sp.]|nr:hypothetical protein [Desulfosporosinus sp.]
MADFPNCPTCNSGYTYEDGNGLVCPECGHEWTLESNTESNEDNKIVKDANGNVLNDGLFVPCSTKEITTFIHSNSMI